jgi:hypothetical protein
MAMEIKGAREGFECSFDSARFGGRAEIKYLRDFFFFLATTVAMLGKKKDLDAGFALAYGDYSQR